MPATFHDHIFDVERKTEDAIFHSTVVSISNEALKRNGFDDYKRPLCIKIVVFILLIVRVFKLLLRQQSKFHITKCLQKGFF